MTHDEQAKNLVVEFVVPHYFLSLLMDGKEIAGDVWFREEPRGPIGGVIRGFQNSLGEWLIDITETTDPDRVLARAFIENVERIEIM